MIKTNKKTVVGVLSFFAVVFLILGILFTPTKFTAGADNKANKIATSLVMQNGASVRINKTESYEDNGIRFSANISNAEYETARLMNNAVFGMFIMPKSYVARFGDLTAENVNVNGIYDWKEDGSDEYFYGGDEIQAESHRIIAIVYDELPDDEDNDGYKRINGSVISIKDANLELEYIARAFIRYEVDGFYFYEMADWHEGYYGNNVRSVTDVTWKALKDTSSKLTDNQKTALSTSYTVKAMKLQEYTAIKTAEEFAAMSADGKYYLANDIVVNSAYSNAFTGVLNGNGKTITQNSGVSLFNIFAGTLENANITASASVISTMNDGIVRDCKITYTYSESNPYAVATNSQNVAQIENVLVYTDNGETKIAGGKAFVSNCVNETDSSVKYHEVTVVSAYGKEAKKYVKDGATGEKATSDVAVGVAGKVNAWNKSTDLAVTSDSIWYAQDCSATYDETAAWL